MSAAPHTYCISQRPRSRTPKVASGSAAPNGSGRPRRQLQTFDSAAEIIVNQRDRTLEPMHCLYCSAELVATIDGGLRCSLSGALFSTAVWEQFETLRRASRDDARAVEQVLIEYNGLGEDGGSLLHVSRTAKFLN